MTAPRRATPDDWPEVSAVRLAALADSPRAFGSTLERESAYTEPDWRRWCTGATVFLAPDGTGLAGAYPDGEGYELVSMWVAPAVRGTEVASSLIEAVAAFVREEGKPVLTAWVGGHNARAARFYARHGFVPTGRREPNPAYPDQLEVELSLTV